MILILLIYLETYWEVHIQIPTPKSTLVNSRIKPIVFQFNLHIFAVASKMQTLTILATGQYVFQ